MRIQNIQLISSGLTFTGGGPNTQMSSLKTFSHIETYSIFSGSKMQFYFMLAMRPPFKTIATLVTEHTQLSDSSSLYSLSTLLSLGVCYERFIDYWKGASIGENTVWTKVISHEQPLVIPCIRSIGRDSL